MRVQPEWMQPQRARNLYDRTIRSGDSLLDIFIAGPNLQSDSLKVAL